MPGHKQPTRTRLADVLTPRETEIVRALLRGGSAPNIAEDLDISAHTVREHVKNLYRKLGVRSRLELVLHASRNGWLSE